MTACTYIVLNDRGLLRVSGDDAVDFLQGLVSNDVTRVGPECAVYSAMLSPQGKFLHDFFIFSLAGDLLIDCELARIDDLKARLGRYRLRSKVDLENVGRDFVTAAIIGDGAARSIGLENIEGAAAPLLGGVAFIDPRLARIGGRAVIPRRDAEAALAGAGFAAGGRDDYETLRLKLGLPDGSRDMVVDRAILLENGFAELNGVDWDKGCYMGQELTARTHYRVLIKKRLLPVTIEGPLPEPGTPLTFDGDKAGEMRSGSGDRGLALVRLEQFRAATESGRGLSAGTSILHPVKPDWVKFQTGP